MSLSSLYNFLNSRKKIQNFKKINPRKQAYIYRALSNHFKKKIAHFLSEEELINLFKYLDDDEIVDCLQFLPKERSEKIIKKSNKDVQYLLKFNPDRAGGKMDRNFIIVNYENTIKEVQEKIKKREKITDKNPVILVVRNNKVLGQVKIFKLLTHHSKIWVGKLTTPISVLGPNASTDEIIDIFSETPYSKIVIAEKGEIIGVVHSEDILSQSREYSLSKVYKIFGVRVEESIMDPFTVKIKNRLSWLSFNLITALIIGIIVSIFEKTIATHVIIAAFLPVIANLAGNGGTQTLAVMIRGITLDEISLKNVYKPLIHEIINGVLSGLFIGLLMTIVMFLVYGNPILGYVATAALMITLASAGIIGSLIPLLLRKFNFDPAAGSGIFITTLCDIIGFFSFLYLAHVFA
jgi:magnesium transporter